VLNFKSEPGQPLQTVPVPANDNTWTAAIRAAQDIQAQAGAAEGDVEHGPPQFMHSGAWARSHVPPDYLLDGVMQAGYTYSITGQTGAGKTALALLFALCVATGRDFAGREVKRGTVFYFAGENPEDVKARWIGLCDKMGVNPDSVDVYFVPGVFSLVEFAQHLKDKADEVGGVELVTVDTTAAYFLGDDENSNTQMGRYARVLRGLTTLKGSPAVLSASHPVKGVKTETLVPRGGGAFLNEMDGNLSLAKSDEKSSTLHWQGKHRGPDFRPMLFDMVTITTPKLVDSRGREMPTVMAVVVEEDEQDSRFRDAMHEDRKMLVAIRQNGSRSLRELGEASGFGDGDAAKRKAQTVVGRLKKAGCLEPKAVNGQRLTRKGAAEADEAAEILRKEERAATLAAGLMKSGRTGKTYRQMRGGTEGDIDE
jgi:hypothetical protein